MRRNQRTFRATKRQWSAAPQDSAAHSYRPWPCCCILFAFAAITLNASEPPSAPEINRIEPFVWRLDATNSITIEGKNLSDFRGLWTSRHGIVLADQLTPVASDDGKKLQIATAPDPMTAPGPFAIRVITDAGISEPIMAMFEALPELKPGKDGLVEGDGYIDGHLKDDDGLQFRVKLKQGENFTMDVSAGRFGSKLDPVLRITDSKGTEVEYEQDSPGVDVDCFVNFKVPNTGDYAIEIRDASYGSGNEFRYHVRFGPFAGGVAFPYVEGSRSIHIIPSHFAAPEQSQFARQFAERELVSKPLGVAVHSDPRSNFGESTSPAYSLRPVANYPVGNILPLPEGIRLHPNLHEVLSMNGYFRGSSDQIGFDLMVKNPVKARYVAMSRRLGGECDPLMRIEDKNGKVMLASHMFNNEAVLTWDFEKSSEFRLKIWDAAGQFGPNAAFHIQAQEDPTEFELNSETDSLRIPAGGEMELTVSIDRDGYNGPIRFEIASAPDGVSLEGNVAKEKSKEAKFKLKLADSLMSGTTFPIKIHGRRGEKKDAPQTPLYTSAYWKKQFPNLYSPMFEFEDTLWVTVLPAKHEEHDKK